jgi:hypothetical protein
MISLLKTFLGRHCCAAGCAIALLLAFIPQAGAAEDGLKRLDFPDGGLIVYGSVQGQSTQRGAMAYLLRTLHNRYGEKPAVGGFFRTKDGHSLGAFFVLTDKSNGDRKVAGMILVRSAGDDGEGARISAAMITDDENHFASSMKPMVEKLDEVWKPEARAGKLEFEGRGVYFGSSNAEPVAQPLHEAEFSDKSGSIGLPEGWKIAGSSMGSVQASGPNGEELYLGVYVPVADSRASPLRNNGSHLSERYVAAHYGDDPFQVLVSVSAQLRAKQKLPPASIDLIRQQDKGNHCTLFEVNIDGHDSKGKTFSLIRECMIATRFPEWWGITFDQATLPKEVAEKELPTIQAMARSYRINDHVIRTEAERRYGIDENADRYRDPVKEARERPQEKPSDAFWEQEDGRETNLNAYLLEDKFQGDSTSNGNAVADADAEALVKAHPERYEMVTNEDLLKGLDY